MSASPDSPRPDFPRPDFPRPDTAPPVITPRAAELPAGAGQPVDARRLACDLLRRAKAGVLSTLDPGGYPLGSVTNIATMPDGTPFFFAALLAVHARNLAADSRAALTLAQLGRGDALVQPRLGLVGRVEMVAGATEPYRARYLRRHPKGKLYLALPDARFFRLRIEGVHLGAGPGRNAGRLTPAELVTVTDGAEALLAAEATELAALNARPDLVARLAEMAGGAPGRWQAIGLDPEGIDLLDGDATARFTHQSPVRDPEALRAALIPALRPGATVA